MVRGDWLEPGVVVIDVGINRIEREGKPKLVSDVAFDEAEAATGALPPCRAASGP